MPPEAAERPDQSNRPHIVMVTHYFEDHRGGIEIVAGRLARELARLGYALTWAATGDRLDNPCWKALPMKAWNATERAFGVPLPVPSSGASAELAQACADADAIIVHDGLYPTSVLARLAGRRARKPVMIVQHVGAIAYRNPLLRLMMSVANRLIARPMLRSAERVVFISETTRAHFNLPETRSAETIFNGVDIETFRPPKDGSEVQRERLTLDLPLDVPIALFVGRFVEKKGLHWLRRLASARPDIVWAFAGWGPLDPAEWGLPNVRIFRGLAGESLAGLYRAADIFTLPSIGEGFPLVVQEALASGLPILCSDEVALADPKAKHLLRGVALDRAHPERTVAQLSDAVTSLLGAEADRAGRHAFARDHYSWASAAVAYDRLIRDMMAEAGTNR